MPDSSAAISCSKRCRRGVRVVNLDALTYAGNPTRCRPLDGNPNHVFVQGDIGDARAGRAAAARASPRRGDQLRRRKPRRPLDRRARRRSCRPTWSAPWPCWRRRATTGRRWTRRRATRSASCTCPPTRSTARSATPASSPKTRRTRRIRRTRRRRPRPTTWCAPSTTPTGCRS